jgi:hypothetical protein
MFQMPSERTHRKRLQVRNSLNIKGIQEVDLAQEADLKEEGPEAEVEV